LNSIGEARAVAAARPAIRSRGPTTGIKGTRRAGSILPVPEKEEVAVVLHVGLDLSRKRIDVCLISDQGELIDRFTANPGS
jgi:hypothetical protein